MYSVELRARRPENVGSNAMITPNHESLIELLLSAELSPDGQQQLREFVASDASVEDEVFDPFD